MGPKAILKKHGNSFPFDERQLDLSSPVMVGRAIAKNKVRSDNATFDCKVLSRQHAQISYTNGKFLVKDTKSSNGTFVNTHRLSPANEESIWKEIFSNDIIQFGVEVIDNTSETTHSCIISQVKLFFPDGHEAINSTIPPNIPTINLLPAYYSYEQMAQREKQIFERLEFIEEVIEEAHSIADMALDWQANVSEQKFAEQIDTLQKMCDLKTKLLEKMEEQYTKCKEKLELVEVLELEKEKNTVLIESLKTKLEDKTNECDDLREKLEFKEDKCRNLLLENSKLIELRNSKETPTQPPTPSSKNPNSPTSTTLNNTKKLPNYKNTSTNTVNCTNIPALHQLIGQHQHAFTSVVIIFLIYLLCQYTM